MRKGEQTRQEIIRKSAPSSIRGAMTGGLVRPDAGDGARKRRIYRHFSNKEALAAEAFDYAWRETLDARIHDLDTIPKRRGQAQAVGC